MGLTLGHTRGHLARAVVEAAALALRQVISPIAAAGASIRELRVSGGPAQSLAWNQLKADVTGLVVAVPRVPETALLGAAITAATGIGAHPDLATATRRMVAIERRLAPDPAARAIYDEVYAVYVDLYPALASGVPSPGGGRGGERRPAPRHVVDLGRPSGQGAIPDRW